MNLKELSQIVFQIRDNHLAHMKEDIDKLDSKIDRMDARLWWILAILVGATIVPLIAKLVNASA